MTNIPERPFEYALNEQRTEATIEIEGAKIVVTAEQLENAIAYLGALRAQMIPHVPEIPNVSRMLPIDIPSISRLGEATEKGAMLQASSPYFGWFQVYLPYDWCSGLIAYLQGGDPAAPKIDTKKH